MMETWTLICLTFSAQALHSHLFLLVFFIITDEFLPFAKEMIKQLSDIWKEEISQAGPRAGKESYGVAQGSENFMGPLQPCGSRPADSSLNSCSGHSW